jgi:NitT/TauT family transport system permease protein
MAATRVVGKIGPAKRRGRLDPVHWVRIITVLAILVGWELLARSGWLFRDVVPSLGAIGAAIGGLIVDAEYYRHLGWTAFEIVVALLIGGMSGLIVGLVLGGSRLLRRAFEPYLYYLGPTPKIIFFPVMILWFGIGPASKIALGAISCFFPIALSTAAGMRMIDPVLVRVGQSFRARTWQMVTKIYLPALRHPIMNGLRLGFGIAVIGTLLAETKLSNRGIGFLIINSYTTFDMPRMYALLILLFILANSANAMFGRLAGGGHSR